MHVQNIKIICIKKGPQRLFEEISEVGDVAALGKPDGIGLQPVG